MKSEKYLFSVVIPIHNKESFLEDAIESVLSQSYKDFEVILVDDASTDGSSKIIKKYESYDNVRSFKRSVPGPGGYAARNFGVEKANSEWVCFCDADDYLEPNHLEELKKIIYLDSQVNFVSCSFYKERRSGRIEQKTNLKASVSTRLEALKALSISDFMNMNSVAIKKDYFRCLGGFPEGKFRMGGDVYFWFKCILNSTKIGYCDLPTSTWRCLNSEVASNPANLVGVNPVALLSEEEYLLNKEELLFFKKCVNKRVLSWAYLKSQRGIAFTPDLRYLSFRYMSSYDWCRLMFVFLRSSFGGFRKNLKV